MTVSPAAIDRARDRRLEAVCDAHGVRLKRVGAELVGPCPRCGGRDRFAVTPRKQLWRCRQCLAGGDVIDLVQHLDGCGFGDAVERLTGERIDAAARSRTEPARHDPVAAPATVDTGEHERRQHQVAAWLWSRRRPIAGTIAEQYLRGRGITCPLPATLGFLPPRDSKRHPAMIAAFGLAGEVEPGILAAPQHVDAVHLTLLRPDGSGKADLERPKLFIGSPGNRPIVLAPPNDLLGLDVTEGIEEALTVHQATGRGAWAAGAANRLPKLAPAVPGYIEAVTVWADADPAGQRGARDLAQALKNQDPKVDVWVEGLL